MKQNKEESIKMNYTDKIIITKQNKKYSSYEGNNNFGTDFENTIVTKSCVNLKIKSINDRNIFTKQYRHFAGIKLLLVYNYCRNHKDLNYERTKFIQELLDNGDYKVIPMSSYYYTITFNGQKIQILYNGTKLVVKDFYNNHLKRNIYSAPYNSKINSETSFSDEYLGTYNFFNDFSRNLELILFSSEAEVDGLFEILDDIQLQAFNAEIAYSNFLANYMISNSILIYEIKSGYQPEKLVKQMKKRCRFICNYLRVYYHDKRIYYLGFYRDNTLKEIEINSDNSLNLNDIKDNGDNNIKKNDEKNNDVNFSEENKNSDDKNQINNNINEEDTQETINKEQNEPKINIEKKNKLQDINNNINISMNKMEDNLTNINMDFSSLDNLPANIVIFRLGDQIFNEKLKYEKEELNLLGTLKDDVIVIKKDITTIKNTINTMNTKIDNMETKMAKTETKFEKLLNAIAGKLGIDPNQILNEKKI